MLRRMFGPKGEKDIGGWRKLYNEELCNFYSSPHIIMVVTIIDDLLVSQLCRYLMETNL
jgi:hypothetical protein